MKMKSLKILMAVAIFSIVSVFIYSCTKEDGKNESKSNVQAATRTDACENAIGYCSGQFLGPYTTTVTIPQYPNCTFEVEYKTRECANGTDIQIVEWGDWPICQDFQDDLDDMILNNPGNVSLWIQQLEKDIYLQLITNLASTATIPNCGSGLFKSYGFTEGSCATYCFYYKATPKSPIPLWKSTKVPCGTNCCRTVFNVCKNPDGTNNVTGTRWSTEVGPVTCSSLSQGIPCHRDTYWQTGCVPNCQAL